MILTIKDGKGLNKKTIIKGGKTLFRLSRMIEFYVRKKNKENIPAEEFAKKMLKAISSAHSTFNGGVLPSIC